MRRVRTAVIERADRDAGEATYALDSAALLLEARGMAEQCYWLLARFRWGCWVSVREVSWGRDGAQLELRRLGQRRDKFEFAMEQVRSFVPSVKALKEQQNTRRAGRRAGTSASRVRSSRRTCSAPSVGAQRRLASPTDSRPCPTPPC